MNFRLFGEKGMSDVWKRTLVSSCFCFWGVLLALILSFSWTVYSYNVSNGTLRTNSLESLSLHSVVEDIEWWARRSTIHSWLHAIDGPNASLSFEGEHYWRRGDLTVLMHVARSTGNTVRYHLLKNLGYDLSLKDIVLQTPLRQDFAHKKARNEPVHWWRALQRPANRFLKGFLSFDDVEFLREKAKADGFGSVRVFTILRHPIERSLSWYKMSRRGKRLQPPPGDGHSVAEFFGGDFRRNKYVQTFVNNSMTWQFAQHRNVRFRNHSLSDATLLALAKEHLLQLDFVGFYETMLFDLARLRSTLFPHLSAEPFAYYAYFAGMALAFFRVRTHKYSADCTAEELRLLRAANHLDLQLFEWAKRHFAGGWLQFDSYTAAAPLMAATLLTLAAMPFLFVVGCCYLRHSRWHSHRHRE